MSLDLMGWVYIVFLTMLVFFVIVTIHEWGHFFFAKRAGILVREFAIGFGPRVYAYTRGETTYTLRLLPLGGYVRMAGEDPEIVEITSGQTIAVQLTDNQVTKLYVEQWDKSKEVVCGNVKDIDLEHSLKLVLDVEGEQVTYDIHPQARMIVKGNKIQIAPHDRRFGSKTISQRVLTICAGPFMNFVLAFVLFGVYTAQVGIPVSLQIGQVSKGMPAEKANLQQGDIIEKINDIEIGVNQEKLSTLIAESKGSPMMWKIRRGDERFDVIITPVNDVQGAKVGIKPIEKNRPASFIEMFLYAAKRIVNMTNHILENFRRLFLGQFKLEDLSGPVRTFEVTGEMAMRGIQNLTLWTAILSLYLGIFNLFPVPALDGSRLVFLFVEAIRGKPIDPDRENMVHFIGFVILMLLMLVVTYHDILRLVNKLFW